jgi:hypothetical protein
MAVSNLIGNPGFPVLFSKKIIPIIGNAVFESRLSVKLLFLIKKGT